MLSTFPGKPDTQNAARGPRNNLGEFWNSGHEFTLFVKAVSESDFLTEDQGAGQEAQGGIGFLVPGCGLGIQKVEGRARSCIMNMQPVLLHRTHGSEKSHARSLVFCNCYLEIFNNFIFEFMFYK